MCAEIERIKRRAPKRSEALDEILQLSKKHNFQPFARRQIASDGPIVLTLQRAGYITISQQERKLEVERDKEFLLPQLTEPQQRVAEQILS